MAMLAADAARVLDDRGIASAHVVGLSMGAAVALELAIRMPHRVKSLVLVGGGAGGPTTVTAGRARGGRHASATCCRTALRHRQAWPAAALFSARFRDEHPDRVAEYMPYFARHRAPPWMTGWQALAAACFGRRGSLARVRAPTLVLHGGRDVMVPRRQRRAARGRASRAPSCTSCPTPATPSRSSIPRRRPGCSSTGYGATRRSSRAAPAP